MLFRLYVRARLENSLFSRLYECKKPRSHSVVVCFCLWILNRCTLKGESHVNNKGIIITQDAHNERITLTILFKRSHYYCSDKCKARIRKLTCYKHVETHTSRCTQVLASYIAFGLLTATLKIINGAHWIDRIRDFNFEWFANFRSAISMYQTNAKEKM